MKLKNSIDSHLSCLEEDLYMNLEKIVNTNSFTANLDGNIKVAHMLIDIAKKYDIKLDIVYSSQKKRPHLMYGRELEENYYGMIGHFDTVHPPESGFDVLTKKGDHLIGPGVNDMKSGVLVALYSLVVLKKLYPKKNIPIKILFNSDEEVGSLDSQEIIENEFKNAKAGFVFEPGRLTDEAIVTARKGICNIHVRVCGKPAHSGIAPQEGANAIVAASKMIDKLHLLNDYEKGLSVGSNEIKGGIATNVVAPNCEFKVDVRYVLASHGEELIKDICTILKEDYGREISVEYDILHKRPPFESSQKSQELYGLYKKASQTYGVVCNQVATGGVSDANFLSALDIPVLDGLGAFGNYSHTQKEFIVADSLVYKVKIFVLFFSNFLK